MENNRERISQSDLIYERPVAHGREGQPIGNGRMGTMVWTTPGALHCQINRSDVFAVNKDHGSTRGGATDGFGGCAQVVVDVGGSPFGAKDGFRQRLSLYHAECTVEGGQVRARCFVAANRDVLALEVDDGREEPQPLRMTVSMWRAPEVRTGAHLARYTFGDLANRVLVEQRFSEGAYDCASAVAAGAAGEAARVEPNADRERTLVLPARKGRRLLLIAGAASCDRREDVGAAALTRLAEAADAGYEALRAEHERWWAGLWSRTHVRLSSADGAAERFERLRNLQLYYLASSSRGRLPAKWNGSLFLTDGDHTDWGAQFWVWTTESSYFPLYAADAVELTDPFFDMYVRQLPAARAAARQRWDAQGAYFLEAGPFDGPVVLPENVATEYRDVYLGRKTVKDLSPAARALGQYECVLTQFADGHAFRGEAGRYSYVSHIASSGSEVAAQAWWRYRYTGDRAWLRSHAYPLLRDTVEFYRSLARSGDDGRYHLEGLNQHEGYWGVNDGLTDLAAIRGTVPLAMRAADILGEDRDLRERWQEFLADLAPYPMGADPQAVPGGSVAPDVWAIGHRGPSGHWQTDPAEGVLWPVFPFEDWTMETRHPDTDRIAQKAGELNAFRQTMLAGNEPYGWANSAIRTPIHGSRQGCGSELPAILANYYGAYKPLPNGFSLFEGAKDPSIEHLGIGAMALNEALLQSVSPRPGEPEIISVFPAWPRAWDAEFRLLARGGFLVTAAIRGGEIQAVEIESRRGETCRIRNPWGRACVLRETGGTERRLDGDVLLFQTRPDARYRLERRR